MRVKVHSAASAVVSPGRMISPAAGSVMDVDDGDADLVAWVRSSSKSGFVEIIDDVKDVKVDVKDVKVDVKDVQVDVKDVQAKRPVPDQSSVAPK